MSTPFPEQVAPGGILVFPQIQSPGFVTGVSGWRIARDGSAEFNNVTIRGTTIIEGAPGAVSGIYMYAPGETPGPGTGPTAWWTTISTTDPFGNPLPSEFGAGGDGYFRIDQETIRILTSTNQPATVIVPPSVDTSGNTDTATIAGLWSAGFRDIRLLSGTYYINAPLEFPQGAVLRGASRSGLGIFVQTTIEATAAMDAMLCSKGWLEDTSTVAQETVTIADLKLYGAGLATHGIVSQNYDSLFENLEIEDVTGDGLRFDVFSQDGTTQITTTGVNNRVYGCTFESCGRGFATNEAASGAAVFTDGFLTDCIVANTTGTAGIAVQRCAGWKITGCHLYGLARHGIQAGQMFATVIAHNYIETWGNTATSGTWRAIDGASIGQSDDGPGSVIAGNRVMMFAAPGNAASNLEGVSVLCDAANHANFSVVGNAVFCEPSAGWSTAHAFEYANQASTSVMLIASTGNMITGNWSAQIVQVPNGGTITLTAGS